MIIHVFEILTLSLVLLVGFRVWRFYNLGLELGGVADCGATLGMGVDVQQSAPSAESSLPQELKELEVTNNQVRKTSEAKSARPEKHQKILDDYIGDFF